MEFAKKLVIVLLFLALIPRLSSAAGSSLCTSSAASTYQWYCNEIDAQISGIWYQWQPIVFLAVFVSFSMAAFALMLGVALKNERIRNFAIGEVYEAVATALIAIGFLSLSAVLFGVIPTISAGPVNPYLTSLSYIYNTLQVTRATTVSLYNLIMVSAFEQSISIQVSTSESATVGQQLLNNTGKFLSDILYLVYIYVIFPARSLLFLFLEGLTALDTEFYLIFFFMYTALPVFLIPGILFRAVIPLRNLGGIMIGIAVAFYMIMPMLFSIAYYLTSVGVVGHISNYETDIAANGLPTNYVANGGSVSSVLASDMSVLETQMGPFWLSILFYPALIMAISYESVKIIAEFIGGAVRTTGKLTRF